MKIAAMIVVPFVLFIAIGVVYESSTDLNMITGEKKTSGVGAEKWGEEEISKITDSATYNPSTKPSCDESYPSVCIALYPPDLDCEDIVYSNFMVVGNDPHGFDIDNNGIGCES
jgi:hypothetical protein